MVARGKGTGETGREKTRERKSSSDRESERCRVEGEGLQ